MDNAINVASISQYSYLNNSFIKIAGKISGKMWLFSPTFSYA